jgi:triosephosphate isomerase (TIM)
MVLIINLKTYKFGGDSEQLVKEISKVSNKIIMCVQAVDAYLASKVKNEIFIQHADYGEAGRNTGFVTLESVKKMGIKGVMLNHSEHKLNFRVLKKTVERAYSLGLKTLVCASNIREAKKIIKIRPDYVAYEPNELIGTGISVTQSKPKIVEKFSKLFKNNKIKCLCGAGVTNRHDVQVSKLLGCDGVLLASAVTKAGNVKQVVKELVR